MRPRARMMEARRRRPHSQRIHFIMNHHRARARARARSTLGGRADRNLRVQVREYHSHTPSSSPPAPAAPPRVVSPFAHGRTRLSQHCMCVCALERRSVHIARRHRQVIKLHTGECTRGERARAAYVKTVKNCRAAAAAMKNYMEIRVRGSFATAHQRGAQSLPSYLWTFGAGRAHTHIRFSSKCVHHIKHSPAK